MVPGRSVDRRWATARLSLNSYDSGSSNGRAVQRWLDANLPSLVASLADRWDLASRRDLYAGRRRSWPPPTINPAATCVLKSRDAPRHGRDRFVPSSVLAHQLAAGRGCALYAYDGSSPAMLLEAARPEPRRTRSAAFPECSRQSTATCARSGDPSLRLPLADRRRQAHRWLADYSQRRGTSLPGPVAAR